MIKKKTPGMRAIWLGQALREIRDAADLTSREAGRYLYRDGSSISRMENGEIPITVEILEAWMEMCGVTDPHKRTDLMTIRKDVAQSGWWDGYKGDAVVSNLMDRAWMESKAIAIRSFDSASFPGLLQIPQYAEALMRARNPGLGADVIERWVEVRVTRQHVLGKYQPLRLTTIIEEHQLRNLAAHPEVMRAQLGHLLEQWDRSNIEIRVLPTGVCTGLGGSFELIDLADPYPKVALLVSSAGEICVEGAEVESLSKTYDRLLDASLDSKASKKLITAERDKL